ncbi:UNVERIFIED_CONTAM: hypothetical protein NCL1_47788 [Trichonephila clavipes]
MVSHISSYGSPLKWSQLKAYRKIDVFLNVWLYCQKPHEKNLVTENTISQDNITCIELNWRRHTLRLTDSLDNLRQEHQIQSRQN